MVILTRIAKTIALWRTFICKILFMILKTLKISCKLRARNCDLSTDAELLGLIDIYFLISEFVKMMTSK